MSRSQARRQAVFAEVLELRSLFSAGLATQALALAGGAVARPAVNTGTGFFVSGTQIYDANGSPFVIRGFNHTTRNGNNAKNFDAIGEFAKTGANAVRTVFGTFGVGASPAQRQSIAEQYIDEGIVPIVEDHSATNGGAAAQLQSVVDRWLLPDNVAWLKKDERNVILNIANEWGPDTTVWRDAYISSIARLRAAGVNALLMVDAGGSGQNVHTLETWARDVEDADPQHNVVFSIHLYNHWRTAGATDVGTDKTLPGAPWDIATEMTRMQKAGLAVVAGEFSSTDGTDVPYDTRAAMQVFDNLNMGWLAWSWNQNGSGAHDMVANAAGWQYDSDADLSAYGNLVINDPTLGLKAVARPATTLRPGTITGTLSSKAAGVSVYVDDNANGKLDTGEKSTVTTAGGAFTLTNLPQGVFRLRANGVGTVPLTVALPAGDTVTVSLKTGSTSATASLSGTLFNDANRDAYDDNGESPVAGQTVYIDRNADGKFTAGEPTKATDAQGRYTFSGLTAGTYRVGVVTNVGQQRSTAMLPVILAAGDQLVNLAIGVDTPPALGDLTGVFFDDTNRNGVQDTTEIGQSLKAVFLDLNNNGVADAGEPSTLTAANGTYLFTRLTPSKYTVRRDSVGWDVTTAAATATVTAFHTTTNAPIGAVELPGSISGVVYKDANGDGVVQFNEAPAAGLTVFLDTDGNGAYTAGEPKTVSDAVGAFAFDGLKSGSYVVRAVPPAGQSLTSGAFTVGLATNQAYTGAKIAVGVAKPSTALPSNAAISGIYFKDANADRRQETGEGGVAGATVFIDTNGDGKPDNGEPTRTTAADGGFSFTGLSAGTYALRAVVAAGGTLSTPVYDVLLSPAQQFSIARIGVIGTTPVQGTASVSGTAFNDNNGNAKYDAGDGAAKAIAVFLDLDGDGMLDSNETSVLTDSNGKFTFAGLAAGTYHVRRVLASGQTVTTPAIDVALTSGQAKTGLLLGVRKG